VEGRNRVQPKLGLGLGLGLWPNKKGKRRTTSGLPNP